MPLVSKVTHLQTSSISILSSFIYAPCRCQVWEKDVEIKEMKEQFKEIVGLLRQSELRRKEAEKELKLREQELATSLASSPLVRLYYILSTF